MKAAANQIERGDVELSGRKDNARRRVGNFRICTRGSRAETTPTKADSTTRRTGELTAAERKTTVRPVNTRGSLRAIPLKTMQAQIHSGERARPGCWRRRPADASEALGETQAFHGSIRGPLVPSKPKQASRYRAHRE